MPPKKKKTAGKSKPHTGARRSGQGKKKKESVQLSNNATANGDPSPATKTLSTGKTSHDHQRHDHTDRPTAPNTTDRETRNAQTQSLLLMLPLEVRIMIYGHVLADKALEIGPRRELRRQSLAQRYNQFTLANFDSKHFAVSQTCREIRKEVEKFVLPRLAFSFLSTNAFACFLGRRTGFPYTRDDELDEHTLNLLKRASSIQIVIEKHEHWWYPLYAAHHIERALKHPLNVEFVDCDRAEGYISRTCREATKSWSEHMERLKALQSHGN